MVDRFRIGEEKQAEVRKLSYNDSLAIVRNFQTEYEIRENAMKNLLLDELLNGMVRKI